MVKNTHLKITGVIFLLLMGSTVFVLLLNINQTKSITSQTYQTPTGTVTTTNVVCQSIPNVVGNSLCNLSNKINQSSTPPVLSSACPNGGLPLNNICPVSVIPLSSNPINNTVTQISVSNVNTETIQVIPNVSILGNDGITRTLSSDSFSIQLASLVGNTLSYISPSTQTIDVSNGNLTLQIQIKARPNEVINANGTLWFSLNNVPIHPVGIFWTAIGTTNNDGLLTGQMLSPQGVISKYVYDIHGLSSTGTILNKNNLNFTISNLMVQNQIGQSYKNIKMQKFYSLELDYDKNMIIQKDSSGNYAKVYPSDDVFTIASNPIGTPSSYYVPCQKGGTYVGDHQVGCGYYSTTIYSPSVDAGSASVYLEPTSTPDGTEKLLGTTSSITSGNSGTISNIPRDADIKIVITGGTLSSTKLYHTLQTQQSYSFVCGSTCSFSP